MHKGILAFRDGRYEEAAREFERAADRDPNNAEAHFLLARVYTETPLKDRGKARRALGEALKLEPDNVTYLVGRLQQLREEAGNFFVEKLREQLRLDLARKILSLDSTNAFAHEELGAFHIRNFWRYRNAVMLPSLRFGGSSFGRQYQTELTGGLQPDNLGQGAESFESSPSEDVAILDPNAVFLADRFDLDALDQLGVPIQDLAGRAQRAYESAIGHLRQALETDPRRQRVYTLMMEIFALKGEYEEAAAMLNDMYAFFPEDPATWHYLGLTHYRLGSLDAAAKSFETAFKFMSDDERSAFESLDYLLSRSEKSSYEDDPVTFASRFWTSKDPRFLTPYNERKLEHYARLVYADLLYGAEDLDLRGWDTERGRIIVRYGVPQRDVVIVPQSSSGLNSPSPIASDESILASGTSASAAETASRQMGDVSSDFDMLEEANTFNIWDYGDFRFVFEDPFRNGEYRLYSPSASQISAGRQAWINDYAIKARETFEKIPERYEYEAPGRQIELPYLVNAFRSEEDGSADVYVHYGVPITDDGLGQETIKLTANVGAFLINDNRDILVERRRTIYGLRSSQVVSFQDAHLWVDTQLMKAPPGHHDVSIEFETASGATVAVQRRSVEIPDFETGRLTLSDVMLAYRIEDAVSEGASGSDINRRGLSISPAPWSVFSHEQPIYLYFEVYDLELGSDERTDYEMQATLVPKDDAKGISKLVKGIFGGTKGVAVSLPGSGSSRHEGNYLILDATNQTPGLYTLTLRVHDNIAGRAVERQVDLFLE